MGLIKICVNMDEEKNRGKRREKRRGEAGEREEEKKKREREKSTDIRSVNGSHKQLKNIK